MYVVYCVDKPDSAELRQANREAHLAYARRFNDRIVIAGPMLSESGAMIGSMLVLDMDDRAEVEAFTAEDPYNRAGLFESVIIRRFRKVLPD